MKRSAIIAAACALTMGVAQGASNGTLGTTSTGVQNVSATIAAAGDAQVRISGLEDVIFGTLTPGRTAGAFTNYCFFHTTPTFSLTVSQSDVSTPGFALLGPQGNSMPLRLTLNLLDSTNVFFSYEPVNGVARTGLAGNRVSENCSDGGFRNSGSFFTTVANDQAAGEYSGTLTFVMAVE
jgi:hypothetical protein